MAEIMATKRRTRTKEVPKEVFGDIPDLPDTDLIQIENNSTDIIEAKDKIIVDEADDEVMVAEINEKVFVEEAPTAPEEVITKSINAIPSRPPPLLIMQPMKEAVKIERLYPSITTCISAVEDVKDKRESLDIVAEMVRTAEAPVEEWQLPVAMPEKELMRYYENTILDNLKEMEKQFLRETSQQMHPLVDLLKGWERSVNVMWQMKERMKLEREVCSVKGKELWRVAEKNGVREARCKDNLVVKKTFVYDEATYDVTGGAQLELHLRRVSEQIMEELCVSQYEAGINKALIESYLVKIRSMGCANGLNEVRQCIAVLLLFLRRPLAHISCIKTLQNWTVYLGNEIAANGDCSDRLYLLWQLMHAPVGVGEWGAALVQSSPGTGEMDLVVAYLAMIMSSESHREQLLTGYNPGNSREECAWTVVDSEGEDDGNVSNNWSLLRESDLTAFLKQVPFKSVFKHALDMDPHDNQSEVAYDPARSCHPGNLLRLMAFCRRIIDILDHGLDRYGIARYKTFNKRISRLIKHTIQFLTDHMELVLGTSMTPVFQEYFPDNTRLLLLAQYETVFESALLSLLFHRHEGNWQCLSDLPWRMLSPSRKQAILYRLIDPHLTSSPTLIDQMVSCLQSTIESAQQSEAIYLLTALSNLALECRPAVATEYRLISSITNVLFQTCYVHPVTRSPFSKVGRELLSSISLQHPQALSFILDAVKLWHPSIGQMGMFLFRELPFCLMIPTDAEYKMLHSWIVDNPPNSVCNQLARYVFTNLNWGFANTEETILYLPLSLHHRIAELIVLSFKKHTIDSKSGQWLLDSMKLVTSLWWNQDSSQEQSFHAWCISLAIRLRINPATRPRVFDQAAPQLSSTISSSDWMQSITDAQQERCSNPVAMYMAITTRYDTKLPELTALKILHNLISRHQQYRLSLELIANILLMSTSTELNYLVGNDTFMTLWRLIIHADDTYYNMVKNIIAKQFPGSVLSCIGNSFCASLIIGIGDLESQESMMRFFLRSVLNQPNWVSDHCCLWLLDTLLEINVSLDLKNQDTDLSKRTQLESLRDTLDTFMLWIDEPRLHIAEFTISGLPQQYRADLLERLRFGQITIDNLSLPRRLIVLQIRVSATQWTSRHDLDLRFVRLAELVLRKTPEPIATRLFQRFGRQTSFETLSEPSFSLQAAPTIPMQAMLNSTHMLEFIGRFLSTMYQCAAKYKANKNFLRDIDKKFLVALSHYYEPSAINQTFQMQCSKGQFCTGVASLNLNYQSWIIRQDIVTEVARNRQEYNCLVDDMVGFDGLEQLVKSVVCLQNLIMSLGSQLQLCKNEDDTKKVMDCGTTLFFHIGRQVNQETQAYPPHRNMVNSCMDTLGATFVQYARNQAHKLLQGILDNDLLVDIYGPHFNPNMDDMNTAIMHSQIVTAYRNRKCSSEVAFIILNKFNMKQFMEYSPRLASRMSMVGALCDAIGTVKTEETRYAKIDSLHVENLIIILSDNFNKCLPTVFDKFLTLCQDLKLEPQFWSLVLRCINENISQHGELSLSIDEIKKELELLGSWLNNLRFSDTTCKKDGLYNKYGVHATPITQAYRLIMDSLIFKTCRSARENIISWHDVISVSWDLLLKVYIPWLQAFPASDGQSEGAVSLPWRIQDKEIADNMATLVVEQLNFFVTNIQNEESQGFLLHCVLIWIINGILVHKQLPSNPYHDTYCSTMKLLRWDALRPSPDCIKLILDFFTRSYNSEQSMALLIEVASKVPWSKIPYLKDAAFEGLLFDMVVTMVCKTRSVFKVESMEKLADGLIEICWDELTVANYGRGMEQLAANLEPRIILSNPSTIEGKVIKLLNHAVGHISTTGSGLTSVMDKQAIYISTVVKLLTVAFSFTQTKGTKGKSGGDDSQLNLFQLRVSVLLTEMETVVNQVNDQSARHNLALRMLAEALILFRNHAIAGHALDPVIGWIQESRSSALIIPFLIAIYRWPPHVPSMVRLANELIEAYILSETSDGSQASWTTVTACARLSPELEQQYLRESVRENCILCLVQQLLLVLPLVNDTNSESWQTRIVDWLDETRPYGTVPEQGAVLLIFLYLQLLLSSSSTNPKPGRSFDNMIQLLLKLSQSKKTAGLLGMVGMGKKSSFSFQFRVMCRSIMVYLQCQLPTNNLLRTMPHQPGGLTSQNMTVASRMPGEPLPTNKTLQNLDWLKSQRQSKELTGSMKPILEMSITFVCDPAHSIMDTIAFMRLLCQQLWPHEKLLSLIHANQA